MGKLVKKATSVHKFNINNNKSNNNKHFINASLYNFFCLFLKVYIKTNVLRCINYHKKTLWECQGDSQL